MNLVVIVAAQAPPLWLVLPALIVGVFGGAVITEWAWRGRWRK
jgi:hypothetical protein